MRLHRGYRRRLCNFQRLQLPDANSRRAGSARQIHQNVAPRGSAGAHMNAHAKEFNESARRYTVDLRHRDLIQKALSGYYAKRDEYKNRFQNWSGARDLAAEIKWEAINHLDRYLDEFASKLEARGTKVFWAPGAQEARDYIVGVARQHKVRFIIKSKSMMAEEIHLNDALEKEGFEVVESDLGEYIMQLRCE